MKEHFLDRLYGEYQAYRASVLACPNVEIFNRCYEIDAIVKFYEILAEMAGGLSDGVLETLLQRRDILAGLYDLWLKKNDSCYTEMQNHVRDEIESIAKNSKGDDICGEQHQCSKASES